MKEDEEDVEAREGAWSIETAMSWRCEDRRLPSELAEERTCSKRLHESRGVGDKRNSTPRYVCYCVLIAVTPGAAALCLDGRAGRMPRASMCA